MNTRNRQFYISTDNELTWMPFKPVIFEGRRCLQYSTGEVVEVNKGDYSLLKSRTDNEHSRIVGFWTSKKISFNSCPGMSPCM